MHKISYSDHFTRPTVACPLKERSDIQFCIIVNYIKQQNFLDRGQNQMTDDQIFFWGAFKWKSLGSRWHCQFRKPCEIGAGCKVSRMISPLCENGQLWESSLSSFNVRCQLCSRRDGWLVNGDGIVMGRQRTELQNKINACAMQWQPLLLITMLIKENQRQHLIAFAVNLSGSQVSSIFF